jgi:uncharacterized membrane protein YhaH (DUF805 family)
MTTRTQYLLFITIWVGAFLIGVIIVEAFGLSFGDDAGSIRTSSFVIGTLALLPAAAGFAVNSQLRISDRQMEDKSWARHSRGKIP